MDNERLMEPVFKYTDMADAPHSHREVARWAVLGLDVDNMQAMLGITRGEVNRILEHEPVVRHIEKMQALVRVHELETERLVETNVERAMRVMDDMLQRAEDPESGLRPHERMKIVEFYADRDPAGRFTKRTKVEENRTVSIFDSRAVQQLQLQGKQMGKLPSPESINERQSTVDADFEVVGPGDEGLGGDGHDDVRRGNADSQHCDAVST